MKEDLIKQVELGIKEANQMIEMGASLTKLLGNRDFKKVILDGYLEKEAVRLVHLKSAPSMQGEAMQASIVKEIDGIGSLIGFFRTIEHTAEMARVALADHEQTLEELNSEEEDA
ncbi:MAG: hypothetical protein EP328_00030 [Gammaproteobacteria bacterium]|nr:MAG: hypothetical protein EP328_00030 [Gammaproteobacteria bacterium]